jgi:Family of unknown function (DUF6308)
MHLHSGLDIPDPWESLSQMRDRWYDAYDGVPVATDNQLRVSEIALSVMLNSRISGNTAFDVWENRAPIEQALRDTSNADLLEARNGIPHEAQLRTMIDAICGLRWVGLASATKILHKKRPGLIPIFDSRVHGHYCHCKSCTIQTGDHLLELTRSFQADMISVARDLRQLRDRFARIGKPLSPSRILDHLIWVERGR